MSRTYRKLTYPIGYGGDSTRDKKKWWKPDKIAKKIMKKKIRNQIKDAITKGIELPRFRKVNIFNWN